MLEYGPYDHFVDNPEVAEKLEVTVPTLRSYERRALAGRNALPTCEMDDVRIVRLIGGARQTSFDLEEIDSPGEVTDHDSVTAPCCILDLASEKVVLAAPRTPHVRGAS